MAIFSSVLICVSKFAEYIQFFSSARRPEILSVDSTGPVKEKARGNSKKLRKKIFVIIFICIILNIKFYRCVSLQMLDIAFIRQNNNFLIISVKLSHCNFSTAEEITSSNRNKPTT